MTSLFHPVDFTFRKAKCKQYPEESITDANDASDQALLANTLAALSCDVSKMH